MIFDTPGKITDRIWLMGRRESCAYVIGGNDDFALLGGAMAYVAPDVVDQLAQFGIAEESIRRIVVLHSHFDHCGMVPYLKRRWPWATVTGSPKSRELLRKPKVVDSIASLNRAMIVAKAMVEMAEERALAFTGIEIEAVVGEGDVLACSDLTFEIMEVPGHSSCSIAVYVPEEKALFASDAAGIPFGERVFTAANSNFDLYQQSLARMAAREVDILLAEHYGARTGDQARQFLQDAVADAQKTRSAIEASYAESGDADATTEMVTDRIVAQAPEDFLPREVVALVAGQMVRFIAKAMSPGKASEAVKSS